MEAQAPKTVGFTVRQYQPDDREAIRHLCCSTGFLGNPIDPIFEDRELFADFLTDYYLKREPDATFVVTVDGTIKGYVLGCRFPHQHQLFSLYQGVTLGMTVLFRYMRYRPETRRYIHWLILNARREVPEAPANVGHFHINFLPEIKRIMVFRATIETFLRYLSQRGVKQISAQMVTFDDRRGLRLFERYGFKVLNRSRITKFDRFTKESVYLTTVLKTLVEKDGWLLHQERTEETP